MNSFHYVIAIPYGLETSGTVVFANRLCRQLTEWGFEVAVLHIGQPHHSSRTANHISFEHPNQMLNWIENDLQCDVIFWGGFFNDPENRRDQIRISAEKRKQSDCCLIYLWERTGFAEVIPENDLFELLQREGMDVIATLNVEQRKELIDKGVAIDKISLFSTGIDTLNEFTAPTEEEKTNIRRDLNWKPNEVIGLCVGRFVERKRMDFVIESLPEETAGHRRIRLVLLGTGFGAPDSIEPKLIELASSRSNVDVILYRPTMNYEDYFRGADFFVSASVLEGEPTVLQEAMAMKIPVIASDVDGHQALVKHNWTGLLFETFNGQQLKDAIGEMAVQQKKRRMLGENARTIIIDQRDIRVVAARFLRMSQPQRKAVVSMNPPISKARAQS